MGSAALGGGSGNFGGGSGAGGGGGGRGRTDSLFQRLSGLLTLTRNLNKDPNLAQARAIVHGILQDRGRGKYVARLLGDPFVQSVYRELLAWGEAWRNSGRADGVAALAGVDPSRETLQSLAFRLVESKVGPGTDERFADIAQATVSGILNRCVEGDQPELYAGSSLQALGDQFHPDTLSNVAGEYLSGLLRGVVRREVRSIDPAVAPSLFGAIDEISTTWVDRFIRDYRKGNTSQGEMLAVIAANWPKFAGED